MNDKPKRPATSGTRRGNGASAYGAGQGAGYGGPANGAGKGSDRKNFGPTTNAQGHNAATTAEQGNKQALWRQQAEELMDTLRGIALDPERGMAQVKALDTFHNRVWGTPRQTVALEGDAAKPLSFVFVGVPEKETTDEWASEHSATADK